MSKKTGLGKGLSSLITDSLSDHETILIKKSKLDYDYQNFLELGFTHDNEIKPARVYSYNLKTYNNKRGWNNPEGWANPENLEKYRW